MSQTKTPGCLGNMSKLPQVRMLQHTTAKVVGYFAHNQTLLMGCCRKLWRQQQHTTSTLVKRMCTPLERMPLVMEVRALRGTHLRWGSAPLTGCKKGKKSRMRPKRHALMATQVAHASEYNPVALSCMIPDTQARHIRRACHAASTANLIEQTQNGTGNLALLSSKALLQLLRSTPGDRNNFWAAAFMCWSWPALQSALCMRTAASIAESVRIQLLCIACPQSFSDQMRVCMHASRCSCQGFASWHQSYTDVWGHWCVPGSSPQNKAGANGKKGARTSVGAMNLLANAAEDNEAYEHLLTPAQLNQLQQHLHQQAQVSVLPGPRLTT